MPNDLLVRLMSCTHQQWSIKHVWSEIIFEIFRIYSSYKYGRNPPYGKEASARRYKFTSKILLHFAFSYKISPWRRNRNFSRCRWFCLWSRGLHVIWNVGIIWKCCWKRTPSRSQTRIFGSFCSSNSQIILFTIWKSEEPPNKKLKMDQPHISEDSGIPIIVTRDIRYFIENDLEISCIPSPVVQQLQISAGKVAQLGMFEEVWGQKTHLIAQEKSHDSKISVHPEWKGAINLSKLNCLPRELHSYLLMYKYAFSLNICM